MKQRKELEQVVIEHKTIQTLETRYFTLKNNGIRKKLGGLKNLKN